jgi:hypothetical protein
VYSDNGVAAALLFETLGQHHAGGKLVAADLMVPTTVGGE